MSKITKQRLAQVLETLDETAFTASGFIVDQPKDSLVLITYRDEPKHRARLYYGTRAPKNVAESIALSLDRETVLCCEINPGDLLETERRESIDFDDFQKELRRWAKRLENEIAISSSFFGKLHEFEEEMNRRLNEHFADANAHFSPEEREDVLNSLRELEKRFVDLQNQQQATAEQVSALKAVIAELTSTSSKLPKKAWFRSALSRLYSLSEKLLTSQAGQKALEILTERLLQAPKP